MASSEDLAIFKSPGLRLEQRLLSIIPVLQIQMPIIRRGRLTHHPRLIQRFHYLLRQWTLLLNILQILLQLRLAGNAYDDPVATPFFDVQRAVMDQPPERGFD